MKCALVTGGSRGIGRAIALQLSKDHGLHVIVNYARNDNAAQEAVGLIKQSGGSAELLKFNVQDGIATERVLGDWIQNNSNKQISVLINNAGIVRDKLFMWMEPNDWNEVIDVSLKGMYNVTRVVLRQMMIAKFGRIINVASLSGVKGAAGQTNYAAAKAGLIGATKSLAQEVARMNITANAVAPGFIDTEMTQSADIEKFVRMIPVGRVGTPEEVAHVVSFLASEKASYICGEVIHINGGLYT